MLRVAKFAMLLLLLSSGMLGQREKIVVPKEPPRNREARFGLANVWLGMSREQLCHLNPDVYECKDNENISRASSLEVKIEGFKFLVTFMKQGVSRIIEKVEGDFVAEEYDRLYRALVRKYGPPKNETTNVLQNSFGARYPNRSAGWVNDQEDYILLQEKTPPSYTMGSLLICNKVCAAKIHEQFEAHEINF